MIPGSFLTCFARYKEKKKKFLKEHNHVFPHAQQFDVWTGGRGFKDARIDIDLSQIRLHRPQSSLALP